MDFSVPVSNATPNFSQKWQHSEIIRNLNNRCDWLECNWFHCFKMNNNGDKNHDLNSVWLLLLLIHRTVVICISDVCVCVCHTERSKNIFLLVVGSRKCTNRRMTLVSVSQAAVISFLSFFFGRVLALSKEPDFMGHSVKLTIFSLQNVPLGKYQRVLSDPAFGLSKRILFVVQTSYSHLTTSSSSLLVIVQILLSNPNLV